DEAGRPGDQCVHPPISPWAMRCRVAASLVPPLCSSFIALRRRDWPTFTRPLCARTRERLALAHGYPLRSREPGLFSYDEPSLDDRQLFSPRRLVPAELACRERRGFLQRPPRMSACRELRATKHDIGQMAGHLLPHGVRDLRSERRRAGQTAASDLGLGAETQHVSVLRAVVVGE